MIDDAVRRAALGTIAATARTAVLTTQIAAYRAVTANCGGIVAIAGHDEIASLVRVVPGGRVVVLVANGAFAGAIGAFFGGGPLARAHPLVLDELVPLFLAAGWQVQTVGAVRSGEMPPAAALPFDVNVGGVALRIADAAMSERMGSVAYLVTAGRA